MQSYWSRDPFSRMHSPVPDDCRLDPGAGTAPEMDALDRAPLKRLSRNENLGVPGKRLLQVIQEVEMLLEKVI